VVVGTFFGLPDLTEQGEKKLIVNCSWTTSTLAKDLAMDPLYDLALSLLIDWFDEQDILVVAAAGNNRLDGIGEVGPRAPARFDSSKGFTNVLSVAATEIEMAAAARYTNDASGTGVATLGGDAELSIDPAPDKFGKAVIEIEGGGELDAVKGIFADSTFVISGGSNTTGWAEWAGTSFATPIISAIAAVLWTPDPNFPQLITPWDVIEAIRGGIGTPGYADLKNLPFLNTVALYARQEIQ
jgi:subtilisin family serine protease